MKHTYRAMLIVGILILGAGCTQITDTQDPNQATIEETTTVQVSDETTTTETTSDSQSTQSSETTGNFEDEFDTGHVLVSLREVPEEMNKSGERLQVRDDVSADVESELEERQIIRFHERSFKYSGPDSDPPQVVISTAIVFESSSAASEQLTETYDQFRDSGATVSETTLTGDTTVTKVQFTNANGLKTVGYYYTVDNLAFYVLVADTDAYAVETTERLFIEKYGDFSSIR